MTCQVIAFPAASICRPAPRLDERQFRARPRPVRPDDFPDFAGLEYADARLKDAVRTYAQQNGYALTALRLTELADEALKAHAS